MATEAEKIAFLEEHVGYELAMLNYTFMHLATLQPATPEEQLHFNAFLESLAVHAHNLVRFLSERPHRDDTDDRNAVDYVTDFEAPDQIGLQQPLFRLQKNILNVTALRTSDPHDKFSADDARELYTWIMPAMLKFEEKLSARYRGGLNALGWVEHSQRGER
jgi:hypothetical protein